MKHKIDAYAHDGKIIPIDSISPKQKKEIEKGIKDNADSKERALKVANKKPSQIGRWVRRMLVLALAFPMSGVTMGCCAAYEQMKDKKVGLEMLDGRPEKPEPELKTEDTVITCEGVDRSWLEEETAKGEVFDFFMKHISEHIPNNAVPIDMGGKVYTSAFNYRGLDFRVQFFILAKTDNGKVSGSSLKIQISEAGFQEEITLFVPDDGTEL